MMAPGASPDILEVTLRDGSYLIDFQFTAEDTALVAGALESAGLRWIEVGHGLGLHASRAGKGQAAATDEEYLEAAARTLRQARWGMFFIPGIGREEDLRLAARYGMHFVRVGTNITDVEQARPFIELARDLGMLVSYNAMKSYAVAPAEFGRQTARAAAWGADIVCLVDSAGGMYPDDVSAYLAAARAESDAPLGFHGHDNLALAMANTLRAIECGAALVDVSLQGMGRSAGNAITEVLVAILKQRGLLPRVDLKAVMDIGQGLIQPLLGRRGLDPMAITSGYARFHSSFTAKVQGYAEKYGLDARDLIVRLCQEDQVNAPDDRLEHLGREMAAEKPPAVVSVPAFGQNGAPRPRGPGALGAALAELRPRAVKAGKYSVLNVVVADHPLDEIAVSGNVQSLPTHVVGSVALSTEAQLAAALGDADGAVDVVLLDVDRKPGGPADAARAARGRLRRSRLLTYSDGRVWAQAVEDQIVRLLGEDLQGAPVVTAGDSHKSRLLALYLAGRGARVALIGRSGRPDAAGMGALGVLAPAPAHFQIECLRAGGAEAAARLREARAVAVWPEDGPWFGADEARYLSELTDVLDAGIGAILPEGMEEARRRGARLARVNIWPALAGALLAAHESARSREESLGWATLAGIPVVAGGALGRRGDVIVDSVREPSRVIGVADGGGGVLFEYGPDQAERARRVQDEINRRLVRPRRRAEG